MERRIKLFCVLDFPNPRIRIRLAVAWSNSESSSTSSVATPERHQHWFRTSSLKVNRGKSLEFLDALSHLKIIVTRDIIDVLMYIWNFAEHGTVVMSRYWIDGCWYITLPAKNSKNRRCWASCRFIMYHVVRCPSTGIRFYLIGVWFWCFATDMFLRT